MITPGLKAKLTFAFDTYNENFVTRGKEPDYYSVAKSRNDEGELVHSILKYGSEFLDHSSNANYGNQSVYLEAALSYNQTFNNRHMVDALLLYNQRSYDWGDIQPNRHKVLQDVFHIHLTAAIFLNSTLDIMVRKTLRKASVLAFSLPSPWGGSLVRSNSWNLYAM